MWSDTQPTLQSVSLSAIPLYSTDSHMFVCIHMYACTHVSEGWRHCGSIGHGTNQTEPHLNPTHNKWSKYAHVMCPYAATTTKCNNKTKILDYIVFYWDIGTKARKRRHNWTAETTAIRPSSTILCNTKNLAAQWNAIYKLTYVCISVCL